ncbi:hypothetical protein HNO88_002792 [Novosphingobium chloroacetimidivorans]|uniref:Head-tail adaptor protein n=1 Tax=Novosphingobium chloroacetimidivorans TaxID=1428314 RepID=A0A7W7NWD8_9SPHN|nr:head-tail adaptor protein [Novosphingobium chloroacetimidivorans]MBB4859463.1 hypothetical protein [Novosphingobium chloroacetimidivorans]
MVRIERKSSIVDGYGNPIADGWAVVPGLERIAAAIAAQRGGEEVRSMRASGIDRFDVTLRIPVADITIGDRMIDHNDAAYDILWIGDLEGRGRQINVTAQRGGLND